MDLLSFDTCRDLTPYLFRLGGQCQGKNVVSVGQLDPLASRHGLGGGCSVRAPAAPRQPVIEAMVRVVFVNEGKTLYTKDRPRTGDPYYNLFKDHIRKPYVLLDGVYLVQSGERRGVVHDHPWRRFCAT